MPNVYKRKGVSVRSTWIEEVSQAAMSSVEKIVPRFMLRLIFTKSSEKP